MLCFVNLYKQQYFPKNMLCVVGLGYVGLPLAVTLGKKKQVVGFDINKERIAKLKKGIDETNEVSEEDMNRTNVLYSADPKIIRKCNFIIVAVPTPLDEFKNPDITILKNVSKTVGQYLQKGSIVVYESTVYPGCTERDCVPLLEKYSGLKFGRDFTVGYSPERINPGDAVHRVDTITKVVAGSDKRTLKIAADVYRNITTVHEAPSIMVAEAAKVIENTQRDINIALMNELKIIFDKVGINYKDVLEAAGTKWNFLKFSPGLVGGHCIGVDPYYLAQEAERLGHHPQLVLAGRQINDDMSKYEGNRVVEYLISQNKRIKGANILILGATFKPDVPDMRNSKVEEFAAHLKKLGCEIAIYEPYFPEGVFGYPTYDSLKEYDLVVKAVHHKVFENTSIRIDYTLF